LARVIFIRGPSLESQNAQRPGCAGRRASLVLLRAGGYSERRKATRSEFSCWVNPMPNRVS
jgi:hypothetical protein